MMSIVAVLVFVTVAGAGTVSGGSPAAGEWKALFDGKTLNGWVNGKGEPVSAGWVVEDGVLHRKARGGDIFTAAEYLDFELEFEWKIAAGGNSGVKYRLHRIEGMNWLGPEYQILDDAAIKEGKDEKTSTASLYLIKGIGTGKKLNPAGEFNKGRIVASGSRLEHWLNGQKIAEIDTSSQEWRTIFAQTKYNRSQGATEWFARDAGPIMLQDHGSEVWFRNIRIRELKRP